MKAIIHSSSVEVEVEQSLTPHPTLQLGAKTEQNLESLTST